MAITPVLLGTLDEAPGAGTSHNNRSGLKLGLLQNLNKSTRDLVRGHHSAERAEREVKWLPRRDYPSIWCVRRSLDIPYFYLPVMLVLLACTQLERTLQ